MPTENKISVLNNNFIRTILGVIAMLIVPALSWFGCTVDQVTGMVQKCVVTWLEPQWSAPITFALGVIVYAIKGFGSGGTLKENLVNPAVPVVPPSEAKPGVVTPTQVKAS